jgi:hypothetical protein
MPLICRLFADERGVGKLTVAVFFVVSAVVALLVFPQLDGVLDFLRALGERLATGAFW